MRYELIRESFPVAAKDHRCIWCGETILKNTKHRYEISRFGDLQNHRWHLECNEAADFSDGPEFEAYENQRPTVSEK